MIRSVMRPRRSTKVVTLLTTAALTLAGLSLIGSLPANAADAPLSQGKTATASSSNGGNTADKAVDGDLGTRWEADWGTDTTVDADHPEWLQVDLGSSADIGSVTLVWETADASAYTVQTSDDASNWTTIDTVTDASGISWSGSQGTQTLTGTGHGRYVRVLMTARGDGSYGPSLWEFQVWGPDGDGGTGGNAGDPGDTGGTRGAGGAGGDATCPTTNIALNQPAKASSVQSDANAASAAVDGNATTRWSSAASDPQWLQVDLGSSQAICGVSIAWEAAYASAFEVQTSENGTDWTDIYSTTTSTGGTQNLDVTGSGRFIRIYGTARGTTYGYSVYEFQVFSTGADGNDDPTLNAGCQPDGSYVAPAAPDFGDNVVILDPSMTNAQINAKLAAVSNEDEFSTNRHQVYFLPGTYGCGTDTDNTTATNIINADVGFYESVAGLGASPDDVTINGALHVEPVQSDPTQPWAAQSPGSLDNFWRSLSNVKINPIQQPVGDDASRQYPEGVTDQNTMRWAVSQASPLRRVDITGNLTLFGRFGAYASGGYLADSKVAGQVVNGSQQQWYTRDSEIGSWSSAVWNQVFSGVTGAPSDTTYPSPAYTTLSTTPESREAPFLYVDGGEYRVFVPNARQNASGVDWSTDASAGTSLPIGSFFIAKPSDSAQTINAQLAAGKNLIITPGVYDLSESLKVTRADTVILGQGEATLSPTNGNAAIEIGDVKGVKVTGVTIDAGATTSDVLIQVGPKDATASDPADPTTLSDVFVRIGGAHAGSVKTAIVVNSDNVLLDDIWSWRADHGTGVGWTTNTAEHGLVVNGDHVTATGLFVEHYQQAQVVWNGNDGTTVFYQSELPYDPPTQADWMDGTRDGYASYQVADTVTSHDAYGLGIYSFFDPTREKDGVDQNVFAASAIQAPVNPNVTFHHVVTQFLNGGGGIQHGVNSTGDTVSATSPTGSTAYIVDYPAAGTPATAITFATSPAAPAASGWYRGPVSLTVGVTGDDSAALTASVDGADATPVTGALTLGDGDHTVTVTAKDADGDVEAVASWTGKVDGTAPTVSASRDAENSTVQLTAGDSGSGVAGIEYAVDGGAWQPYSAPVALTGTHTVAYRATDAAGNVSKDASIDVAPAIVLSPAGSVRPGSTVNLTGSFVPDGAYSLVLHSTPATVGAAKATGGAVSTAFVVPAGTDAGSHVVQLVDADGNVVASAPLTVTAAATGTTSGTATGDSTSGLASTGSDLAMPLIVTVLLLLLGAAAILLRRRRA
ncbi:discoidin domain-containing protein [Humibacter ginsenosidimutans]|nr:discoidin domain-containing protein [Humibacter ginsenosidimutans]